VVSGPLLRLVGFSRNLAPYLPCKYARCSASRANSSFYKTVARLQTHAHAAASCPRFFPTGCYLHVFIGAASGRGSFALGLPAASWHPDEAAPLGGMGGAKQPHRRLALSMLGRAAPARCRYEIKDFHGTLLSSWPLNWSILKRGLDFR
jgi:hypothetical protein